MDGENDASPARSTPVTGVSQNEPSSSHCEPRNRPARRGRRGTRMMDVSLSRSSGSKLEIHFDENLEPFGPNKNKYTSFVGYLARSKASILTDEWKNVDFNTVKQPIWDTIRLTYTVPDSERLKNKTLSYCAVLWRKFKTSLTNKYIFAEVPPPHMPWDKYSFIDEQTWQQFVQLRTTPEAVKRREQAQEIGRKNDCPHRASRGGYEQARKELMAAKRKRLEDEAESNPSAVVDPPSPIRRDQLWLYIRQKPSGTYTSEQTRVVAERIEDLKKKEAEGSFVSDGRNDVLTVATGKPDHPGRVRGIGGRVGLRQFFGKEKRHKQSMVTREEMEQTVAKLNEEAAAKAAAQEASLTAMFQSQMRKMQDEMDQLRMLLISRPETSVPFTHSPTPMQQSTRGSCIVGQSEQPCDLCVEDPHHGRQFVAKGTVHNLGSTVHHQEMADDEVRVSVEKVIIDAPLPLPTDQLKVVSDVKGTFISWPVQLVHVTTPHQAAAPPHQAAAPAAKLAAKEILSDLVSKGKFKVQEWSVDEVVGVPHSLPVYVDAIDVHSLLVPGEELSNPILQMFMKFMHQDLERRGKINDFGFLCPVYASTAPLKERKEYITKRLRDVRRKVYLFPYYHSRHWQLVVMCMELHKVIFLCSTHSEPQTTLVESINDPMRTFQIEVKKKPEKQVNFPTWHRPKTRRQPTKSNLCGLYIMIHIYDIITRGRPTMLTAKRFSEPEPFPDDEVEHIRNVCCEYLYDLILKSGQ